MSVELKVYLFIWSHNFQFSMSLGLSPNSLYRQTTDCTEGGGLTREHCIFLSSVCFLLIFIRKVCELVVYLCNDTGNDHTGSSDISVTLCIINLNSLLIIPSCTRKRSLSCHHQWSARPSFFPHDMFSNNEFSIVEFDCCLREKTVPILLSFIKKIKCL